MHASVCASGRTADLSARRLNPSRSSLLSSSARLPSSSGRRDRAAHRGISSVVAWLGSLSRERHLVTRSGANGRKRGGSNRRGASVRRPDNKKTPPERGFRGKRLKGFEPSTFCMAIRQVSENRARRNYQLAGISRRGGERPRKRMRGDMRRYAASRELPRRSAQNREGWFHLPCGAAHGPRPQLRPAHRLGSFRAPGRRPLC